MNGAKMNKKANAVIMDQQGSVIIQSLIYLVVIILSSAGVLLLINLGILTPKSSNEEILLSEFIPLGRSGELQIAEFNFCSNVDQNFDCISPKEEFSSGEEVHFNFVVESSTYDRQIMIVENYRLINPEDKVLLEVDEKNNFHFDMESNKDLERVKLKDYFILGHEEVEGEYRLELLIENPLLNKRVTLSRSFMVRNG